MWPHERSLVKNLDGKPFAMIGVNLNGYKSEKLKEVIDKEKLTWRSFADEPGDNHLGRIATTWNIHSSTTLYVLDHKGVIRYRWHGSPGEKKIDEAIEKLLKEAERDGKKDSK